MVKSDSCTPRARWVTQKKERKLKSFSVKCYRLQDRVKMNFSKKTFFHFHCFQSQILHELGRNLFI